jgi:hypothetical protein
MNKHEFILLRKKKRSQELQATNMAWKDTKSISYDGRPVKNR